jgi:dephospho-CoA kinase
MASREKARLQSPLVLAVVGMSGSGKSLVVDWLTNRTGGTVVYFGGVVIEEIQRRGLHVTEENEASVRLELRREFGMAAMAVKRLPEIERALKMGRQVVIDGLYSYSEFRFLQKAFPHQLKVIAVHAPMALRIDRLRHRPVRPLTLEEVVVRDRREIEDLEKGGPIALADYHLVNCSSPADLYCRLEQCIMSELADKPNVSAEA